jgi:hypothetical protein
LIKRAAAFVILNQVIFYLALAHNTRLVGKIGKLSSLDELQGCFDHIAKTIDYKAVFGAKVVSMLPPEALTTLNSLIENLETLNFYNIKREILGKIYHNLIPHKIRKRIAAYYTSNSACELLARLTIQKGTDLVLDPSCGSGGFLVAAYNVKKELAPGLKHEEIINSIYGFDISLFASHLSVINLSLQNLQEATDEVFITVDDAFNQYPSETLELLWSPPNSKVVAAKDGIESKRVILPRMDVVLMNPPFTRIERLESNYQDYLVGQKGILRKFAKYVKGQSGLHCFFLLHATSFLKDRGRIGIVLPAATFSSEYGEKIQPFILKNYRILYIITYESQSTFSVDCDFKEILLVAVRGKNEARSDWNAKIVILKKELSFGKILPTANQLLKITEDVKSQEYEVRTIPKSEFEKESNWMTFTRPQALRDFIDIMRKSPTSSKQERVVSFHEGYHMDAPHFFRIPGDYWEIATDGQLYATIRHRQTAVELNIPKKYLIPTLDVPDAQREILARMKNYVFSIPESEPDENLSPDVREYIKWGSDLRVSSRDRNLKSAQELYKISNYTKSGRRWYTYGNYIQNREGSTTGEKIQIGSHMALVEKFRTRKRECIVLFSRTLLTGSNSYFFGVLDQKIAAELVTNETKGPNEARIQGEKLLAAWFSSTLFLALYVYYRREISLDYGYIKIGDMSSFPCVDPSKLSGEQKSEILEKFDKLTNIPLPTLYEQLKSQKLRELDLAFMKALGIKQPEKILDQLYSDLISELDRTENAPR